MEVNDMLASTPYQPDRSLLAKLRRRLTQYRQAAPVEVETETPLLSITFDDCPETAVSIGAEILNRYNVRGGFYISTALLNTANHIGQMASEAQIRDLHKAGHEIGAHSHTHLDCAASGLSNIMQDVETNLAELKRICPDACIESFAFPYGETSYSAKQSLADNFSNLRGILPGINRGKTDRAHLRAYEIDRTEASLAKVMDALKSLQASPGWMVVFTHDVSETPSDFGMRPDQLTALIEAAQSRGIQIVTPGEATHILGLS